MTQRGPESGGPHDRVEGLLAPVGPAGAGAGQPLDHRHRAQAAPVARLAHRRHGHDVAQRGHAPGRPAGGPVAHRLGGGLEEHPAVDVVGQVAGRAQRRPVQPLDHRQQVGGHLGRGVGAAHDEHALPGVRRGPAVAGGVHLGALEVVGAGHGRHEGPRLRAGGADDRPGRPVTVVGAHPQPLAGVAAHLVHPHRATHVEAVALLVVAQVGDHVGRGRVVLAAPPRHRPAGQRAVGGGGEEPQARPRLGPGAARPVVRVEDHPRQLADAPAAPLAVGALQVEPGRQPGLPGPDDAHVDLRVGAPALAHPPDPRQRRRPFGHFLWSTRASGRAGAAPGPRAR